MEACLLGSEEKSILSVAYSQWNRLLKTPSIGAAGAKPKKNNIIHCY
jgi:hypothetical protein